MQLLVMKRVVLVLPVYGHRLYRYSTKKFSCAYLWQGQSKVERKVTHHRHCRNSREIKPYSRSGHGWDADHSGTKNNGVGRCRSR